MNIAINCPQECTNLILECTMFLNAEVYQFVDINFLLEGSNREFNESYVIQDINSLCIRGIGFCCKMSDGTYVGDWELNDEYEQYKVHKEFEIINTKEKNEV